MKLIILLIGFGLFNIAFAKELFTRDKILQHLTVDNPFVYAAIGKSYIYADKEKYFLGAFDTKLSAKYDNKDYPISDGELLDLTVEKPIENGMEFMLGYRDAQGTQEYNNIKTSDDSEVRAGIKIPIFSVLNNMSDRKLDLNLASLDIVKFKFEAKDNLRLLYFQIISEYNKLLYSNSILELEEELLSSAKKRESIIRQRVAAGSLADIALLEAEQQIINRKQRLVSARNDFYKAFENFLKYLNISREDFEKQYAFEKIDNTKDDNLDVEYYIDIALRNRPDLKVFDYEIKKVNVQEQHTKLLKYPNLNVSLYGVHDFKYNNGFKIAIDMDFPIERRAYEGKYAENKSSIKNIESIREKEIISIKTNLTNIINSLKNLAVNIEGSRDEVVLVEKLEKAENKKYDLGLSNLFMVNQREIYTLQIKKKLLKYNLDYTLLQQELNKEVGLSFILENYKNQD